MNQLLCEWTWLGGPKLTPQTLISIVDDQIVTVEPDKRDPPPQAQTIAGVTLPGMANAHSHSFHRAMRASPDGSPSFWSWREQMYQLAGRFDPDNYYDLARATFAEMLLAGITTVGEFHYLHHQPDGSPYTDPNEMGHSLIRAAADAGIRLTLIDSCYLHAGVNREPLSAFQMRFSDGTAERWAERVSDLRVPETTKLAAAFHSIRGVDELSIATVAKWADQAAAPLHAHVAEQPAEVEAALGVLGRSPVAVIADAGALGERFTAVHATHVDADSIANLAASQSSVCFCPTTERQLADGIGPSAALAEAGVALCFGSDSNAIIDPFEEMRVTEMHQRLATLERGHHESADLLKGSSSHGHRSLGWFNHGRIEPGAAADLVTVGLSSPRLAGARPEGLLNAVVGSATASDVAEVMVDGRWVVREGRHLGFDVIAALDRAIGRLWS